ncbi:nuclear transport factor 2 family protein [Mycobacterium sp. URHB0044]|jgi:ketosteroid isomerase-like protein|uniref:nuclear transport factor 2 family protein n=1 Tax=Mycobacterium sp. URHB0044 TaxID=1380386 RepID=UPI00048DFC09|nr:nuclear transport factor 2 family protein [Mycobacterium sp. URHB0044]
MSKDQNIETLNKGYAAFSAGDAEGAMRDLADDVEWVSPGKSALSGTYRGKAEVGEFFMKLAEKGFTTTPNRFIADGDDVIVLSEVRVGDETAHSADLYTLRDGKVVRAETFSDTAMMERIYGAK